MDQQSRELDVFEQNFGAVASITLLMKAQVRTIFDRLIEVRDLPGDVIEFGAFNGGLSFFLGLCIRDLGLSKKIYMLDSFCGLPQTDPALDGGFTAGLYSASLESVRETRARLGLEEIVDIRPGWFEDSTSALPPGAQYCLAHLDADVYSSTKTALAYLIPRLVDGGAVVLDDCLYLGVTGVLKAVTEALGDAHLHLGPKTQVYVFPKGDSRSSRLVPVWKTIAGQAYDIAELRTRNDYFEFTDREVTFIRDLGVYYAEYLSFLRSDERSSETSHQIASMIGFFRRFL